MNFTHQELIYLLDGMLISCAMWVFISFAEAGFSVWSAASWMRLGGIAMCVQCALYIERPTDFRMWILIACCVATFFMLVLTFFEGAAIARGERDDAP